MTDFERQQEAKAKMRAEMGFCRAQPKREGEVGLMDPTQEKVRLIRDMTAACDAKIRRVFWYGVVFGCVICLSAVHCLSYANG